MLALRIGRSAVCLFALGYLAAGLSAAYAQQEAPAEAPANTESTEDANVLAPLEAHLDDETAFVDTLWSLGNEAFDRIDELRHLIENRKLSPEETAAAAREIGQRIAQLVAISEYGIEKFGNNARVRNFRGNVLYDALGKQTEGVKEWHTAVSLDSNYSNPYNNLGMHYFHVGRYPLGFQNMDMALKLDPDNPDFLFNMAQNYLVFRPQTEEHRGWTSKKVYKEAMKLSKKAIKEAPDDFQLLQDYAINFLAAENYGVEANWNDAIDAWVAARKHAPGEDELFFTWLNEGRVWRTLGKNDEAVRCFREALALKPDNELTQRLIENLTSEE